MDYSEAAISLKKFVKSKPNLLNFKFRKFLKNLFAIVHRKVQTSLSVFYFQAVFKEFANILMLTDNLSMVASECCFGLSFLFLEMN